MLEKTMIQVVIDLQSYALQMPGTVQYINSGSLTRESVSECKTENGGDNK